jgi:hypothetical protein
MDHAAVGFSTKISDAIGASTETKVSCTGQHVRLETKCTQRLNRTTIFSHYYDTFATIISYHTQR